MALLPEFKHAIIPIEKIRDYCLNPLHPYGKHKAKVFEATLGIKKEHADWLCFQILQQLPYYEATKGKEDSFGKRYTVDLKIRRLENEVWLRTGWILLNNSKYPRLTTCFIKNENKQ